MSATLWTSQHNYKWINYYFGIIRKRFESAKLPRKYMEKYGKVA